MRNAQRKRDDNKNKICIFQGGGWAGGQRGKLSKTLFFVGNATTIKFWKWIFYCREILLSWRRLLNARKSKKARELEGHGFGVPGFVGEDEIHMLGSNDLHVKNARFIQRAL